MTSRDTPEPAAKGATMAANARRGLFVVAATLAIAIPSTMVSGQRSIPPPSVMEMPALPGAPSVDARFADFGKGTASPDVRHVADWIADSRDSGGSAFIIIDKKFAKLYVFDSHARLHGSTAILLGSARGDDSVPGIGSRPIAEVRPEERTTPAGRFIGERGRNLRGEDVVWVDYDDAVSIHRVLTTNPAERRLERLATAAVDDNRISYGCINVPVAFYEAYVRPLFAVHRAVIYVLPEIKSAQQVFGSYDVAAAHSQVSRR